MRDAHLLPKAHLHLHLEASARPAVIAAIAARHGASFALPERWTSFEQFNDAYAAMVSWITEPDDLTAICRDIVEHDAEQGVRYIEPIMLMASYAERFGMTEAEVFALVRDAFLEAAAPYGIEIGFQLAGIWTFAHERNERTAQLAAEHAHMDVVAFNYCGIEPSENYRSWRRATDIARDAGLKIVPHAGEFGPAANVASAIEDLDADRICHGVRAIESAAVMDMLAEGQIACDMAPTSNIVLGVVPDLASHPIGQFLERGIPVTLNADDELFFGSGVGNEYVVVRDQFGLTDAELADIARTSVNVSFAPATTKARINQEIDAWLAS